MIRIRLARALRRFAYRLDPSWGGMVPGRKQPSDSPEFAMGDVPRVAGLPVVEVDIDAVHKRKRDAQGRFVRQRKGRR